MKKKIKVWEVFMYIITLSIIVSVVGIVGYGFYREIKHGEKYLTCEWVETDDNIYVINECIRGDTVKLEGETVIIPARDPDRKHLEGLLLEDGTFLVVQRVRLIEAMQTESGRIFTQRRMMCFRCGISNPYRPKGLIS